MNSDNSGGIACDKGVDEKACEAADDEDEYDDADRIGAAAEVVGRDGLLELVLLINEGLMEAAALFLREFICLVHILIRLYCKLRFVDSLLFKR